jgi:hypothetical protein
MSDDVTYKKMTLIISILLSAVGIGLLVWVDWRIALGVFFMLWAHGLDRSARVAAEQDVVHWQDKYEELLDSILLAFGYDPEAVGERIAEAAREALERRDILGNIKDIKHE